MKTAVSEKRVFYISIVGLFFLLFIEAVSIYKLSKNVSPTLYTFVFSYSLFATFGILYYLLESKIKKEKNTLYRFPISNFRSDTVLSILFYIIAILILIVLSDSLYIKPTSYYLLVSIATVIIGLQIISKNKTDKKQDYAILFLQIMPLAIIIRYSSYLINPYIMGPDSPWHFYFIQKIIENGHLDSFARHFYYYPFYHLTQSMGGIVLGFSTFSFNLINLSISVVAIIIAYLIGKEVFNNNKVGLMCALLLTIATTHIFLLPYNSSKIGGTTVFLLCLLLLVKMCKSKNIKTDALLLMLAIPVFFWHPEVSFALMTILGANVIVNFFMRKKIELNSAFTLYLIAYIAYLIYVHTQLFTEIVQSLFIEKPGPILVQSFAGQTATIEFLFQTYMAYLGIALLTFFVSYIGLKWLHKPNEVNLFILFSLLSLHILPVIGIVSGNFGLNPERTLTYISILLIFIAAGAIFEIFEFKNRSNVVFFLLILLVFSFFSVSSYFVGDGNNVFNDKIPVQTTYTTESNLASYIFLNETPPKSTIISDYETIRYTSDPIRGFFNLPTRQIADLQTFEEEDGYFVINQPNLERLNWRDSLWGEKVIRSIGNKNMLYNNGDLLIYNESCIHNV